MSDDRSTADRLKARLTGAVALLIIGAVAWFWLLDADSPIEPVVQESSIPPAPDVQPFAVPEPQAPTDVKPVVSESEAPVVPEPSRPATVVAVPTPTASVAKPVGAAVSATAAVTATSSAAKSPAPAVTASVPAPRAEKFEMDANGLPVAWVVQVGAMATPAAADKLRDQLIAKGFKAYTQPSKLANGSNVIKVFVGPKLSRARAEAQQAKLDAELKSHTMLVRFPAQ